MHIVRRDTSAGYYSSSLWVPKSCVNADSIRAALTLPVKKGKNGESFVFAWSETPDHLVVPRKFFQLSNFGTSFPVFDVRPQTYERVNYTSHVVLDALHPEQSYQRESLAAMLAAEGGVLQLNCGKGKTVIAIQLIASIGGPAIIIVDTTQLIGQWVEELERWITVPGGVGIVQGRNSKHWDRHVVVTTYATLAAISEDLPAEVVNKFSTVIFEEAHHLGAETYIRSAGLFPGRRYGLTATPERADGLTQLYMSYLGPVLYRDLRTELQAHAVFFETEFTVDMSDAAQSAEVLDSSKELHYGKLCAALGRKKDRLRLIVDEIKKAEAAGRQLLVLSTSKEELINLFCMYLDETMLYSDVPVPTPTELGLTVAPVELSPRMYKELTRRRAKLFGTLQKSPPAKRAGLQHALGVIERQFMAHESAKKIQEAYQTRQLAFLRNLLARAADNGTSPAGLLIHDVKLSVRMDMLKNRNVVFAIKRFGQEALNKKTLDTVVVMNPVGQENMLYQIIGRILRKSDGKKQPIALFVEDNVGMIRGMCQKLRKFFRNRAQEDGGPVEITRRSPEARNNLWKDFECSTPASRS